jgi:class 3 adenylate cyclase/tetratricopeptide (TPR) repeat protein
VTNTAQPVQVMAGTEVRTFLIADVRGYTSFTLEHGDQAAAGLATRFAEVADKAVRARDGNVIELRGDEALAVFTSARQALRAAVELQSGFAAERDVPLKVGIGLDAGEAIPVGAGFRGAALNLAARLCSLAGPGEILASDTVANLARKMDGLEYADRGAVQLKGFTDPVNVVIVKPSTGASPNSVPDQQHRPVDDRAEIAGLPIGGYLGSLPTNPLVGREPELARILSLAQAVANGTGKLVVLAGEPGVGKTRLAQEVTLQVRNAGFTISAGRCYEPQQAVPFYPFVDALASAHAAASPALQSQVPVRWPDLARLLPSLGLPRADHAGSQDQQRLYWEITSFLQALTVENPLAILVDDLHWADAASLDLLLHLARHTGSDRVLLLGTYRDVEVNRQHPLEGALRDLQREELVERIPVRRLQQSNTAALMAATMGEEQVSDEFASLVFRRTEGNPFFIQQVMRMLVERGDVYHEGDHWARKAVQEIDVPESIRSVVGQRLSRLTEETQELLREASILGQTFSFSDLEAMTARNEQDVERALEEAARAGLLREIDRDGYAFDHALTQQSLYGELPTRRRRRLHLAAGEAIEHTSEQKRARRAAELAWHFLEGDEPGRALSWALVAGDGAESVFAHNDAEFHYRTALQLAREVGDRAREVEALEKLGNVLFMLARYQEELDVLLPALQLYRETEDIEGEMRAAAAIGWAYFEVAQRREGVEFLTLVLSRWEATARSASSAAASLHISLGNLHWADGNGDEALPLFVRGAELAAAVGDNRLLGLAESRRGAQLESMARIDEGLEAYDRSIRLSEMTGDLDTLSRTLNNRSLHHGYYRRDWVRAEADLERQIEVARQLAKPAQLAFALKALGQRYWATGEWARARPLFEEAAQIARRLGVSRSGESITLAARLRLMSGEVESATRELEECVTSARERRDTEIFGSAQEYLAQWDLRNHRPAEALKRMEEVLGNPDLEKQFRMGPTTLLTIALAQEGEFERAEILVNEGLAEARRSGFRPSISQWCIATGNVRASQGRWDESRAAFGEALTIAHTGGATFIGATVLHDLALTEALAGNLAEARARFEEELTLLRPMGAIALIDQTESELAHLAESRETAN